MNKFARTAPRWSALCAALLCSGGLHAATQRGDVAPAACERQPRIDTNADGKVDASDARPCGDAGAGSASPGGSGTPAAGGPPGEQGVVAVRTGTPVGGETAPAGARPLRKTRAWRQIFMRAP